MLYSKKYIKLLLINKLNKTNDQEDCKCFILILFVKLNFINKKGTKAPKAVPLCLTVGVKWVSL